ncbi:MAG: terminase large subunit [Chloroflexota bacterium]|nr:terminase large subunit [Chloroflexota bacterium]
MRETGAGETVDRYIDDVMSGRVVTGRLERLMVERQLDDLKTGAARGLVWRPELGRLVVDFCSMLNHSKGKWSGRPLKLEPWQEFVVTTLYGWLRDDGTRRFRRGYLEVARKNGKSTLAAALALYALVADGEPGAEVYCGATKKEQAKIIFAEAQRMARASDSLSGVLTVHTHSIFIRDTASRFVPLSADDKHASGHHVHMCIMDELHEHKTDELWNVMITGMGSREQPMMLSTTTAGEDELSICGQERDYAERVLEGTVEADAFFPAVYAIDEEAEWQDETAWRKANPNLGVSVFFDNMRELADEAKENMRKLHAFLRYRLNAWVSSTERWFRAEVWDRCMGSVDEEALEGERCWGGLDLASVEDVAAWVLIFEPDENGVRPVLSRFFVPRHTIARRSQKISVPYDVWARQGHLIATPGAVIDHDFIFEAIDADSQRFDIQDIAFDRYGAASIYNRAEQMGLTMVAMGQGFLSMSGPSKELERLVLQEKVAYGEQPVMRWMGHNVVTVEDPSANIKPHKAKSKEKIDGVVALIMALDRAMRHSGPKRSVYEDRGIDMV